MAEDETFGIGRGNDDEDEDVTGLRGNDDEDAASADPSPPKPAIKSNIITVMI